MLTTVDLEGVNVLFGSITVSRIETTDFIFPCFKVIEIGLGGGGGQQSIITFDD